MTGEEFGQELLKVVRGKLKQSGSVVVTLQGLEVLLMTVFNPQIGKDYEAPQPPQQVATPPQFPRLKACFDPKKPWIELDRKLVTNVDEEQSCYRSNTVGVWSTIPLDTPLPKAIDGES